MEKVYVSRNYRYPFAASSKAKLDCEEVASLNGFKNIGLPPKVIHNGIIGGIWSILSYKIAKRRMTENGVVFLQYPGKNTLKLLKEAKRKSNMVVMIIHDINSLRNTDAMETLDFLKDVDGLIVHTDRMKEIMQEKFPELKISVLEIFDYLGGERTSYVHKGEYAVGFAGNLRKSGFISRLGEIPVTFKLFGKDGESLPKSENVIYRGCFHPTELGKNLDVDFGLVWDGSDVDTCNGELGEYLRYISPHKLSLYLSSGIPVIVWKDSAMTKFVEENGVGLCISSLKELPEIFATLSEEEYMKMKTKANVIADRLASGYYLTKALERCLV